MLKYDIYYIILIIMDKKWVDWLKTDLNRGCSKLDVITTLKKNNFTESDIQKELNLYYLNKNKYFILINY